MFEPGKPIVTLTDAAATQVRALHGRPGCFRVRLIISTARHLNDNRCGAPSVYQSRT